MKHSSVLSICVVTTKPNIVSLKPHHISIQFAAASDSFDIISRRPVFVKMIFKKTSRKTQKIRHGRCSHAGKIYLTAVCRSPAV